MHNSNLNEIIQNIKDNKCFRAVSYDNSFAIEIDDYVPFVCTAIHSGGNLRQNLRENCLLGKQDRWYEEDPLTGSFISSLPIRIVVYDSRYAYDLNRPVEEAIYTKAWGKEIWKNPLPDEEIQISRAKHQNFYKVLGTLIKELKRRFGACLVYDVHSYNYKRIAGNPPVFNVGTSQVPPKYRTSVDSWLSELKKIEIPNVVNVTEENTVFQGKGYLARFVYETANNTLVIPTEVKKIYCDEESGDVHPEVIISLKEGIKNAIVNHATKFTKEYTTVKLKKKHHLLPSGIDTSVREVDDELYKICRNLEILEYIYPLNVESEKKKFFSSKYRTNPNFRYKHLTIDADQLKRKLYSVPIDQIKDAHIQQIFREIVTAYTSQINMLISRGDKQFFYNSLKYFGEPDEIDFHNSKFLIHCPEHEEADKSKYSANEAAMELEQIVKDYGFTCKIELSSAISAKAMFLMSRKVLKVKKEASFTRQEILSLGHHEVGVHLLTTVNANEQKLKFLRYGLPVSTYTQEGLAILSEYLSGCLGLKRLKELAYRVVAVKSLIHDYDFKTTFLMLKEDFGLDDNDAYYLCVRIYRGGGFTKDYLYLKGFKDILRLYEENGAIKTLLMGKTSLNFLEVLDELVVREILTPPKHLTKSFESPAPKAEIFDYIVSGIK